MNEERKYDLYAEKIREEIDKEILQSLIKLAESSGIITIDINTNNIKREVFN